VHSPDIQELALVETGDAVRRHFDAQNYRRARIFWVVFFIVSFAALASGAEDGGALTAVAGGFSLLALVALVPMRGTERFRRSFSTLLFTLFSLESLLWILLATEQEMAIGYSVSVVAIGLLLLRFRALEVVTIVLVANGAMVMRWIMEPKVSEGVQQSTLGGVVAVAIVTSLAGAIGASITTRNRQEFLAALRAVASRERERLRMREELHDARAIQLAMLPREAPPVDGLDIAGVCVPATEVGGDYYGYFPSTSGALAIAIGDVAGHGVASGLVLAGVRAGLHLLSDEIASAPARVLERLNGIVAAPGGQRLLMTLGLARFDRGQGRAVWVSAGHPPPLAFDRATGACDTPPTAHPPLGTKLPVRLEAVERGFRDGDVWLLVSDGALEARDQRGREFGEQQLAAAFGRLAATESSAGEILDGLLAELSRFRGGSPQEDDLTLVVVRAGAPPPERAGRAHARAHVPAQAVAAG
jgi:serine phosphatase RsbU (regulator of sigma subunit)